VFRALARRSAEAAGRVAVAPPGLRYVLSDAQAADSAILLVDRAEGAPPPVPRLQAAALEAFRRHFAGRLPALAVDPDRMMPTFDRDGTEDNSGKYGHWQQLGRLRVRRRHVLRVFARRVVLTSHFDGFAVSSPSEVGAATAIGYRSARVGAVGSAGVIGKTWERDVEEAVADVFNAVDGARL